jgi:hypothetical protein
MRVYLAGPMRGLPNWNSQAFLQAEERWQAAGWEVVSPYRQEVLLGNDSQMLPEKELNRLARDPAWLRKVIKEDVSWICQCDALALLSGWEMSMGATVELALAQFLGLDTYDAVTMERVTHAHRPWAVASTVTGSWDDVWRGLGQRVV